MRAGALGAGRPAPGAHAPAQADNVPVQRPAVARRRGPGPDPDQKTVEVEIRGISSLLMHAFPMDRIEGLENKPPIEQAEVALYRISDGTIYVPGTNLQRCLVSAASYSKGDGRSKLTRVVAASVFVSPAVLPLVPQKWELDARRVVIPKTKGACVRYRPRFDEWRLGFTITYDEILLKESQVRRVVDDAGARVGVLDFRPEKKGPFGRFMVTSWKAE